MIDWQAIRDEWEASKITFAALAEKHSVKLGTLKSRRSREKWSRDATIEKDATATEKMQPKRQQKEVVDLSDGLNDRQRLFCIYYIKYFNATKAYQKAYECDYETAMASGSRMLRNVKVSAEIDRMRIETLTEKKISADDVLQRYIDIALADIGDYVERSETGYSISVKPFGQMDTSIISELSNTENGIKLKMADKMKAMEVLAKYTDLIPDHFKRQLETEKLKIAHAKVFGTDEQEEFEDDGFNEALDAAASEVWDDADNAE